MHACTQCRVRLFYALLEARRIRKGACLFRGESADGDGDCEAPGDGGARGPMAMARRGGPPRTRRRGRALCQSDSRTTALVSQMLWPICCRPLVSMSVAWMTSARRSPPSPPAAATPSPARLIQQLRESGLLWCRIRETATRAPVASAAATTAAALLLARGGGLAGPRHMHFMPCSLMRQM